MGTFTGIEKAIQDEDTGVTALFWVLGQFTVRVHSGTTGA